MTLTEFLIARIAEERLRIHLEKCQTCLAPQVGFGPESPHRNSEPLTRALANLDAQRRILGIYGPIQFGEGYDGSMVPLGGDGPETYWDVVRELGVVYSDHPDYDEAWRP